MSIAYLTSHTLIHTILYSTAIISLFPLPSPLLRPSPSSSHSAQIANISLFPLLSLLPPPPPVPNLYSMSL